MSNVKHASVLRVKIFESRCENKCHEPQRHQVVALPHDVCCENNTLPERCMLSSSYLRV